MLRTLIYLLVFASVAPLLASEPSFNREIRPILSDKCFFCHGPDALHREADVRLDIEENAKQYAIVPGSPDDSELMARIISDDPDELMPPPESGKSLCHDVASTGDRSPTIRG